MKKWLKQLFHNSSSTMSITVKGDNNIIHESTVIDEDDTVVYTKIQNNDDGTQTVETKAIDTHGNISTKATRK